MSSVDVPLWQALLTHEVVIDCDAPFVFIGRLTGIQSDFLVLDEADAHDLRDTKTNREMYVLDCRQHGIKSNRARVFVALRQVVAVSKLADVASF